MLISCSACARRDQGVSVPLNYILVILISCMIILVPANFLQDLCIVVIRILVEYF